MTKLYSQLPKESFVHSLQSHVSAICLLFGYFVRCRNVRSLLILAMIFGICGLGWGQTVVSYTGMGTITCPASPAATVAPSVTGLTFSQITRGSGVSCASSGTGISGSGFNVTLANAISNKKWYTFSITSDATVSFVVSSMSIVSQVSSISGSPSVNIQYSIGSGSKTSIGFFTPTISGAAHVVTPGTPISVGSGKVLNIYIVPNNLFSLGTTCNVNNSTSVTVTTTTITPPVTYNVTGTGSYCQNTDGLPVGLDNSEVGAIYTLYKGGIAQTPTVSGTGSNISFGDQLNDTYTVKGTKSGITIDMNGSAVITEVAAPVADAGPDDFGMAGVPYTFSGSASNYTAVSWATTGDGTLTNPNSLSPVYQQNFPTGAEPILFELTVTGNELCPDAIDQKYLYIYSESTPLVWTGNVDNDWSLYSNWEPNLVPGLETDVTIPAGLGNYPIVTVPSMCHNISIASDASIIDNGLLTVSGTATVERDMTASQWHLISSPVEGAESGMFSTRYLQKHDENTNGYADITSLSEPLTPMKGFALWGDGGFPASFSGALNTGSFGTSNNLTRTTSGVNSGWNLVGNPYPSSINWDATSGWTKTNINNAIYVENNFGWASYVGGIGIPSSFDGNVAPCQGFFVQVADGAYPSTGTLKMANAVRVNSGAFFLKDAIAHLIRLEVAGNNYTDETVVRFLPEATEGFDGEYDAHKLFSDVSEDAQLYTSGNIQLAINSLPEMNSVPLGMKVGIEGVYTLKATEVNDLPNVSLEDTKTGIFTDLLKGSYTFSASPGENEQRFLLHFDVQSVNETKSSFANIYGFEKTVFIDLNENINGDIFIYNVSGQLISSLLSAHGTERVNLEITGNYIVKVIAKNSVIVKKVWVN